jgi:hypothetical protein
MIHEKAPLGGAGERTIINTLTKKGRRFCNLLSEQASG